MGEMIVNNFCGISRKWIILSCKTK